MKTARIPFGRLTLAALMLVSARTVAFAPAAKLFGQTPEEFATRRAKVRAALNGAVLILRGEPDPGDIERTRFRTDNDILYLTGIEAPDAYLALLPEGDPSGKREILFLPPVPPGFTVWSDPIPGPGPETAARCGLESVQPAASMWETLKPSLQKARAVLLPSTGRSSLYGVVVERMKEIDPAVTVEATAGRLINPLRWKKSPGEIANLRAAVAATGLGQANAARAIRPGIDELSVEGVILEGFRRGGAVREGFPSIVGGGPNSCVLHHFAGPRRMNAGETVVVDIGAEFNYYTADITRTYPCGGRFSPRERALYQLVLDTQRACEKHVVPGKTTLWELDAFARQFLRKSPLRAKDESGAERTMDAFMPHGLGHWLGMDVHDVGGGSAVLEPGVVFTIEPGVYVRSENIGIRTEDDYLVTPAGLEKLSRAIPSEAKDVESAMRAAAPARPR
jgi:Xaa-Pro aminopeptidase